MLASLKCHSTGRILTQFGIPATLLEHGGGLHHRVGGVGSLMPQSFADIRGEFIVGAEEGVRQEDRGQHADVLEIN
jgi:hypothetical protein